MSAALAIREELMSQMPAALNSVREPAKVIAFKAGTTPRCIEALRQSEHVPSLHVGLALARQYPEVRQLLMRLMAAESGDTPESPQRVLDEIQKLIMQRGHRP